MAKQIYIDENGNENLVSGTINNASLLPISANDPTNTKDYIESGLSGKADTTDLPTIENTKILTVDMGTNKTLTINNLSAYPVLMAYGKFADKPTFLGLNGVGLNGSNRTANYSIITGTNSDTGFVSSCTSPSTATIQIVFNRNYCKFQLFTEKSSTIVIST